MELCQGGSLSDPLADPDAAVDAVTRTRFCSELASGLAYLHSAQVSIVHGDLKAANLLLCCDSEANTSNGGGSLSMKSPADFAVKLADFGLATAKNRSKTTSRGGALGSEQQAASAAVTIQWTAPELLDGAAKDFATDVYALGVTLWEIAERRAPFADVGVEAVSDMVRRGVRPKLAKEPPNTTLARLLGRCWDGDRAKRPSAAEADLLLANELALVASANKGAPESVLLSSLGGQLKKRDQAVHRTLAEREQAARRKLQDRVGGGGGGGAAGGGASAAPASTYQAGCSRADRAFALLLRKRRRNAVAPALEASLLLLVRDRKQRLPRIASYDCFVEARDLVLDLEKPLGHGGYGSVYAAVRGSTGERVAVKSLLPVSMAPSAEMRKAVAREADILGTIRHPNVVSLFGVVLGREVEGPVEKNKTRKTRISAHFSGRFIFGFEKSHFLVRGVLR